MIKTPYENYREALSYIGQYPVRFGVLWFIVFAIFFSGLASMGLVPTILTEEGDADDVTSALAADEDRESNNAPVIIAGPVPVYSENDTVGPEIIPELAEPKRIIIDRIGVDVSIQNPDSTDIEVLDQALEEGAVHYPGTGNLNDTSNMFLFAHSSGIPVFNNLNLQAFNGLDKLEAGDIVRVQSVREEHLYKVRKVEMVDADDTWIEVTDKEKKLTLSTCNTFGSKQDRFVVEADFIDSYPLS